MKRIEKSIEDTVYCATFDDDGVLVSESYSCGDITLVRIAKTEGIEETYICAGKVLTAAAYDRLRVDRCGMPAADPDLDGYSQVLCALEGAEQETTSSETDDDAKAIYDAASSIDAFLDKGGCLFGEAPEGTAALCQALIDSGARLAVDNPQRNQESFSPWFADGLAVQLPDNADGCERLLNTLAPYAEQSGYPLSVDDDHRYVYVLDS
ncbi:MAG: hypothetical protein AAGM16_10700 [Pseudomonadota bacterium]